MFHDKKIFLYNKIAIILLGNEDTMTNLGSKNWILYFYMALSERQLF
jgi:hypothetical protein